MSLQLNLPAFDLFNLVKFSLRFKIRNNFKELSDSVMKTCLITTISNSIKSARKEGQLEKGQEASGKEITRGATCDLLDPALLTGNVIVL